MVFYLAEGKCKYRWIIDESIREINAGAVKPRLHSFYYFNNDGKAFHDPIIVLYSTLQQKIASRKTRGPQISPTKISTIIRLSSEVLESFKATGAGWQSKIDLALKQWLEDHTLV